MKALPRTTPERINWTHVKRQLALWQRTQNCMGCDEGKPPCSRHSIDCPWRIDHVSLSAAYALMATVKP